MKAFKAGALLMALFIVAACNTGTSQGLLDVDQFEAKLNSKTDAQLIDVRTPDEFNGGHLVNAQNIDFNAADFDSRVAGLDKSKPVFVYCLAGGRSASAATKLTKMGFKEVYDMKGGFRAWSGAGKAVQTDKGIVGTQAKKQGGMTKDDLDKLLAENDFTIVDFSAKWCGPCKQMWPVLDKISKEDPKVKVIKIDVDENPLVSDYYYVESLPTLFFFNKTKKLGQSLGWYGEDKLRKDVASFSKLAQ